jgi:RHS repeat-associated protein
MRAPALASSSPNYAPTTGYVFNGDTLLATVDQQTASGVATGTAKTRYIHPDHLGSTNVVTDENDNLVQTLDYYPYGSPRVSSGTSTNEQRKFIGQFSDQSGLSYLNARYMDPSRGQFTSEEPIFLALGDSNRVQLLAQQGQQSYLTDPQRLNEYSYAKDNPISLKDPAGRDAYGINLSAVAERGLGIFAAGTLSVGITYVRDPNTGQQWIAFPVTTGVNSGALGAYQSYPDTLSDRLRCVWRLWRQW